ncbi:MAG: hypothetical protein PWR10_1796 [Halanaerobiales bacterium]|nr:hypothetical protein [Halanaerobiales bacterium]
MGRYRLGPNRKIIERRKKVMRLRFVKRWPIDQIAQVLDVSKRTIERDIQAIAEYGQAKGQDIMKQPLEKTVWEIVENHHERQMLRWQEYANAKDPRVKASILNDIGAEEEKHYKLLQSLGVVYKAPEQAVVTTETWEDRIRRLRAEREAMVEDQHPGDDEDDQADME